MTNKLLKPFLILLISVTSATTLVVLACAGGDWSGTEGSMFSPQLINKAEYEPFFRTTAYPFYGGGYDDAGSELFKTSNCTEWQSFFNGKVSEGQMKYWLYEASLNQVDSMIFALKDKPANLNEQSKSHNLKGIVPVANATSFLYYVGFAKRNETFAVKEYESPWDTEPKKPSTVSITKQITGGLNFFTKASDPFLKERYAFQLIRLYYFNKEYDKAISFFDANEKSFTANTTMKWRSFGYKAASYYKLKRYAESNYLYSKLFDEYEPLQKSAYLSFHLQQEADWNQCLALAKNTHEKEILWQLYGLYANDVKAMKEILALNPKSTAVDLLLVRAVNIEEEKFDRILINKPEEQKNQMAGINKDLVAFLNQMSQSNQSANPAVWHLSAAYLNYMKADYGMGDQQLERAKQFSKKDQLTTSQYHLISLIGKIRRVMKADPAVEKTLLPDLTSLLSEESAKNADFRGEEAKSWIRKLIAGWYQTSHPEKAEMINPGSVKNNFKSVENIKKMIAYFDAPGKSDFEKLFIKHAFLSRASYVELLAIRYAQQDDLENALATFKSDPAPSATLLGNPFTIHIKDCHDCDHEASQKTKYTKTTFIEKMLEMKRIALAKPNEAAQNYFLVANGFYNMTYFGNARVFYDNSVDNTIYDYEHATQPEENTDLALKYYLLARDKSTDPEFRAKCTFMAAKCEQNTFFMNKPEKYEGDFKSGKYFAALKKEYASTKYYSEIIRECGYFKTYLGR